MDRTPLPRNYIKNLAHRKGVDYNRLKEKCREQPHTPVGELARQLQETQ